MDDNTVFGAFRIDRDGVRVAQDAAVPVAGRQEDDRVAGGAGAGNAALPDATVESAPVSIARKAFAVAVLVALAWAVAPVAEAQPPIRVGASLAQTGAYAAFGQSQLRGYQLCVKHLNDKGGVLGRKLQLVLYGASRES